MSPWALTRVYQATDFYSGACSGEYKQHTCLNWKIYVADPCSMRGIPAELTFHSFPVFHIFKNQQIHTQCPLWQGTVVRNTSRQRALQYLPCRALLKAEKRENIWKSHLYSLDYYNSFFIDFPAFALPPRSLFSIQQPERSWQHRIQTALLLSQTFHCCCCCC